MYLAKCLCGHLQFFFFLLGNRSMFLPSSVLLSPACWTGKHTNQHRRGDPTGNQAHSPVANKVIFRLIRRSRVMDLMIRARQLQRRKEEGAGVFETNRKSVLVSVVRPRFPVFGLPRKVLKFSWLGSVYGPARAAPLRSSPTTTTAFFSSRILYIGVLGVCENTEKT